MNTKTKTEELIELRKPYRNAYGELFFVTKCSESKAFEGNFLVELQSLVKGGFKHTELVASLKMTPSLTRVTELEAMEAFHLLAHGFTLKRNGVLTKLENNIIWRKTVDGEIWVDHGTMSTDFSGFTVHSLPELF